MNGKADIGLIGLAVMGENLALNMAGKGFTVAVYNRTVDRVDAFVSGRGAGLPFIPCHSIPNFCAALGRPRKIMMMVKAGSPVDALIGQLLPYLDAGDIIIDGGNSFFPDTIRRTYELREKGLRFIGAGISGGEEGALHGPSVMPGGDHDAWPLVKDILQRVAAVGPDGVPCCEWIGGDGAGHYVKMVHNGIEYGDMQMCAEAYVLMRDLLGMTADEMADVFTQWNQTGLNSYLIEIAAAVLKFRDPVTGNAAIDVILDTAGQKGTGKWTGQSALELGAPAATIAEAVFARSISALREERLAAAAAYPSDKVCWQGDRTAFVENIRQALYASKICSYAQGFQLLRLAGEHYGWNLLPGEIALIWRNGCIIRAAFLDEINHAFKRDPGLQNLLLDPFFSGIVKECLSAWRKVVAEAVLRGIPVPAFSSALAYFDGYRAPLLGANMIQAQRDYFGAHTFERIDRPRGEFNHFDWTGSGSVTSGSYNA